MLRAVSADRETGKEARRTHVVGPRPHPPGPPPPPPPPHPPPPPPPMERMGGSCARRDGGHGLRWSSRPHVARHHPPDTKNGARARSRLRQGGGRRAGRGGVRDRDRAGRARHRTRCARIGRRVGDARVARRRPGPRPRRCKTIEIRHPDLTHAKRSRPVGRRSPPWLRSRRPGLRRRRRCESASAPGA